MKKSILPNKIEETAIKAEMAKVVAARRALAAASNAAEEILGYVLAAHEEGPLKVGVSVLTITRDGQFVVEWDEPDDDGGDGNGNGLARSRLMEVMPASD